jgi:PEP-CTERM motif-containing protein
VAEWNEAFYGTLRVIRGGSFGDLPARLQSSGRSRNLPGSDLGFTGFRLANVPAPEPGTAILLMFGMIGLTRRRKGN